MEGYSLRQLSIQTGFSVRKLKDIKSYWLSQDPPTITTSFVTNKYLIFDATYFNHERCMMVIRDSETKKVIATKYAVREDYDHTRSWFSELQTRGLNPYSITMDGQIKVIDALLEVWPTCIIQRCIYHIQRQGEAWLRRFPKTQLARDLKHILRLLANVDTTKDADRWFDTFLSWKEYYSDEIGLLSSKDRVESDTKKAYRVIDNAHSNMFHYLCNKKIPKTSNALEGYFSHLKRLYRNHAGLRRKHLNQYLSWYTYFKNR